MNKTNTDYCEMAEQYEQTARAIYARINELKHKRTGQPFDDTRRYEQRIAILEAEYSHLCRVARYIRSHYGEDEAAEVRAYS